MVAEEVHIARLGDRIGRRRRVEAFVVGLRADSDLREQPLDLVAGEAEQADVCARGVESMKNLREVLVDVVAPLVVVLEIPLRLDLGWQRDNEYGHFIPSEVSSRAQSHVAGDHDVFSAWVRVDQKWPRIQELGVFAEASLEVLEPAC
jgi:hypothetical protein